MLVSQCPDCGNYYNPADIPGCTINSGIVVCPVCAINLDYYRCSGCNKWFHGSIGGWLCNECAMAAGWDVCEGCGDWLDPDDQHVGMHDVYCESCWYETFADCSSCGDMCYSEDMHNYHDDLLCDDCYSNHNRRDWEPAGFSGREVYNKMCSKRKYGIELETSICPNHTELDGDSDWGAKPDGSISGKEFVSDIFYGDDGLAAVDRLCAFAENHDWSTDWRCGYHVHLDVSNETADSRKAIALAYLLTYKVWTSFVSNTRANNNHCGPSNTNSAEIYKITNWDNFARHQRRYEWISFNAFAVHSTFEIRLHDATLDAEEVCNWVRGHATFMDWAANAGWHKVKCALLCKDKAGRFDVIAQVWQDAGCADLVDYYRNVAERHSKGFSVNTDELPFARLQRTRPVVESCAIDVAPLHRILSPMGDFGLTGVAT